jgi:hypothetical protein
MRRTPIWSLILALVAGCGGDGLSLAPVEGVLTYQGKPVADAGVVFSPVSPDQGPPAYGATDAEGHYSLVTNNRPGAPIGEHRVSISKADLFGDEIVPADEETAELIRRRGFKPYKAKHFIPEHYSDVNTSDLTVTVEDKDNVIDFTLSDK